MAVSQPRALPYPSPLPSPWPSDGSLPYSRALPSEDLPRDSSEDSSEALNVDTNLSPRSPNFSYSPPSSPPLAPSLPQPPLPPSSPTSSTLRTVQSTLAAVQGLQAYLNRYSLNFSCFCFFTHELAHKLFTMHIFRIFLKQYLFAKYKFLHPFA